MKIGIPRGLFYYYYGDIWSLFFEKLGIDYIISPETNREIINLGNKYSSDEMCLSLKHYIGHVAYLSSNCDCVLVPRIDNYGINEQTCTNFLACYDIINNLFDIDIVDYNISYIDDDTMEKGFFKVGKYFGKNVRDIHNAYIFALNRYKKVFKKKCIVNMNNVGKTCKKVLLVSHPYNTYDSMVGKPIIRYLESLGCMVIYSDLFDKEKCLKKSFDLSSGLYWRFSSEIIGSILFCKDNVDGIIFLSTFPCGLDSLVNEVVIRKLDKKCLNIVVDDMDAFAGIETRLESFVDILV